MDEDEEAANISKKITFSKIGGPYVEMVAWDNFRRGSNPD
jgi:hypothetical protein